MIKDGEKFAYWFRRITKGAVLPVMFLIAGIEGDSYWMAGVMSVALVFTYFLEKFGIGD